MECADIIDKKVSDILKGYDLITRGNDYDDDYGGEIICYRTYLINQHGEIYEDALTELVKFGLNSIEITDNGLLLHFSVYMKKRGLLEEKMIGVI